MRCYAIAHSDGQVMFEVFVYARYDSNKRKIRASRNNDDNCDTYSFELFFVIIINDNSRNVSATQMIMVYEWRSATINCLIFNSK